MSPAFDSAVAIRVGQALISAGNALPQAVPLTLALVGLTACLAVAARRVVGRGGVALRLPDSPSPLIRRAAAAVAAVEYNPPLWTALGGNVGTIFGNLIMTLRGHPPLETTRTTVLLPDGGSVGLDWVARSAADATASPEVIVVVQHGLCGSAESVYIKELAHVVGTLPSCPVLLSRGLSHPALPSVYRHSTRVNGIDTESWLLRADTKGPPVVASRRVDLAGLWRHGPHLCQRVHSSTDHRLGRGDPACATSVPISAPGLCRVFPGLIPPWQVRWRARSGRGRAVRGRNAGASVGL